MKSVAILLLTLLITASSTHADQSQTLLFFPPPGASPNAYRPLLQALPGYRVIIIKPRRTRNAWENASKLTAAQHLAFERHEIEQWVEDALRRMRANQLKSAAALGHGAGGLAAAAACQISSLFSACLNIDGEAMRSPFLLEAAFDQPFLWLRPLCDASLAPTDAELKDRQMSREEFDLAMSKAGTAMWKSRRISTLITLYAKDAARPSLKASPPATRKW